MDKGHEVKAPRRTHLANERTFLAWIRTAIAIMAFGFLVAKLSLLTRLLSETHPEAATFQSDIPLYLGAGTIAIGGLLGMFAIVRHYEIKRQIDQDTFRPSILLDIMVALILLMISVFVIFYLVHLLG